MAALGVATLVMMTLAGPASAQSLLDNVFHNDMQGEAD